MLDVKISFLIIASTVLCYHIEIDYKNFDNFSVIVCKKFPVAQNDLYNFVTFPDMVDKVCLFYR